MSHRDDEAQRLVRRFLEGRAPRDSADEDSQEPGAARGELARQWLVRGFLESQGVPPPTEPPAAPFRAALKPGWALEIEGFDDETTAAHLERLVNLPIGQRRKAALADDVEPTPLLIVSLVDAATALCAAEPEEANSMVDGALLLTSRASVAGGDCRLFYDLIIEYWLRILGTYMLTDQVTKASSCLSFLGLIAELGGDQPDRLAQIGLYRAQSHWHANEIEAALTELEANLVYCELTSDKSILTSTLFCQALALEKLNKYGPAREAAERCIEVAPMSEELIPAAARALLVRLAELL